MNAGPNNGNGLDLNGFTASAGALSGSSSGLIQSRVGGTARLITNSSNNGTFAGTIQNGSGTVGYTKQGTGTQYLTGTSTYTDTTLVQGGSLYVNGLLSNTGTSTVTVSGGLLSGSGTIARDVTVASGGSISAGADANLIGTLTVGNLTLQTGGTASLQVNDLSPNNDMIVSTGTTTFGGTLAIEMNTLNGDFKGDLSGSQWTLFTSGSFTGALSSIVMTGVYGNVTFGQVPGNPDRWESQYLGDGKEFAFFTSGPNAGKLFAVPEPSALALAAAGGACLLGSGWRRGRRKNRGDTTLLASGG